MSGRNDFPVIITPVDVTTITDIADEVRTERLANQFHYGDITTARVLIAFARYLESQHVPMGFELDLYPKGDK